MPVSVAGMISLADASPGVSAGAVAGPTSSDGVNGTWSQAVGRKDAALAVVEPP